MAENLPGNPALYLTEGVDSPLYRVGAGLKPMASTVSVWRSEATAPSGEKVKQNAGIASLEVSV